MARCSACGSSIDVVSSYDCHRCTGTYCSEHRLPEAHDCPGLGYSVDTDAGTVTRGGDVRATRGASMDWVDVVLLPFLLPFVALRWLWSAATTGVALLFDVRVAVAVFVGLPLLLVAVVGAGVIGVDDVAGTPAEEPVKWAEDVAGGAQDVAENVGEPDSLNATEAGSLIHEETNSVRDENGLADLRSDQRLDEIARSYSQEMARRNFYGHVSPDGETLASRKPPGCSPAGENLLKTYHQEQISTPSGTEIIENEEDLAEHSVDEWMNSAGHRRNLLDDRWTHMGIGVAIDDNTVYITQVFCGM